MWVNNLSTVIATWRNGPPGSWRGRMVLREVDVAEWSSGSWVGVGMNMSANVWRETMPNALLYKTMQTCTFTITFRHRTHYVFVSCVFFGHDSFMYNEPHVHIVGHTRPFALFTNFPEWGSHCIVTSLSANNNCLIKIDRVFCTNYFMSIHNFRCSVQLIKIAKRYQKRMFEKHIVSNMLALKSTLYAS